MAKPITALDYLCNVINNLQSFPLETIHFLSCNEGKKCGEAVLAFWNVLHNLTCHHACEDLIGCTKLQFANRCYKELFFYSLSDDISSREGDWEILLAFSWLICNNILEEKIELIITELFSLHKNKNSKILSTIDKKKENKEENNLLLLAGKLRHCYYQYNYYCSEKQHLQSEVHKRSSKITSCDSSIIILSCYNKENLDSFFTMAERANCLINSYIFWKSQEKEYLKWITNSLIQKQARNKKLMYKHIICGAEKAKILFRKKILESIVESKKDVFDKTEIRKSDSQATFLPHLKKIVSILNDFGLAVL